MLTLKPKENHKDQSFSKPAAAAPVNPLSRPATEANKSIADASLPNSIVLKPSLWRRAGAAISSHPRLLMATLLLALASGTSGFLFYQLFKGAWADHRDNMAIVRTIAKMEWQRDSALPLEGDPQRVVTRTYLTLEPHVETDGWQWINRFGSTITYGKQDQRLIASCSPFSPLYLICDLSEIP